MPAEKLTQMANIWLSCTEYVISAGLLWWISLVQMRGFYCAKISASAGKSEIWNIKSGLVPLIYLRESPSGGGHSGIILYICMTKVFSNTPTQFSGHLQNCTLNNFFLQDFV